MSVKAKAVKNGRWDAKGEFRALATAHEKLKKMTPKQALELAVRAGIYTQDGKLTPEYGGSASRRRSKG